MSTLATAEHPGQRGGHLARTRIEEQLGMQLSYETLSHSCSVPKLGGPKVDAATLSQKRWWRQCSRFGEERREHSLAIVDICVIVRFQRTAYERQVAPSPCRVTG